MRGAQSFTPLSSTVTLEPDHAPWLGVDAERECSGERALLVTRSKYYLVEFMQPQPFAQLHGEHWQSGPQHLHGSVAQLQLVPQEQGEVFSVVMCNFLSFQSSVDCS